MVKNIKKVIVVIAVMLVVVCSTSKIGKVVNSNYVEFTDGTGYYMENGNYKGNYKIFWFIDIIDMIKEV